MITPQIGVIDYILRLKEQGVVRHIGLSPHTPEIVHQVLDMGILDVLVFSINPAYDYQQGEYGIGSAGDRMGMYRRCEKEGVGLINKYYDLALAGDVLAAGHYDKLAVKAGACVKCGHCQSRCPFHVKQEARLEEIARYFQMVEKSAGI